MMTKKKETKIDWRIVCTGLACLTAIELYALSQGIDGKLLGIVLLIIGAAIGITIDPAKILKIFK